MKTSQLKVAYLFNLIWMIALAHIIYSGLQPYPHYITGELMTADMVAIIYACAYCSLYFVAGNIFKFSHFWDKHPYWAYILLSSVLIFQLFIAAVAAMHAPPYIGAFIINTMFLLLIHFVFYPIYAISRKHLKPQKN
ncbi:hypothetical protein B9T33_14230 [Acinetobacter sp. ANC 5054]|uniref:hypothetical protein n=1 Tax=Acinetobacter sp. ANC 5054 TaxID=1977877 RepID=UPI000A34675D|nr:hypothetical protein [Acinetobacter sp. ANC 5054]OTG78473.1 hypothetical protein B9T33_14230 [Acinetobacter sp. ANC 5054]